MKKMTILFIIGFLFVSMLLYSSDSNKVEQERLFQLRNSVTAEHLGISSIPSRDAGDILSQFNPPISPWGVGYDGEFLWFSDAIAADTNIHQYATDGTATGVTIDCSSWMDTWVGDMAYTTGYIFAVNVGGDNNIYKLDENTGDVVEIISGEWNTTSARGLAYDPANDEFYIGGWNHTLIYHIDATGATISTIPFASVSGLGWHPMGNNGAGTLWVTESSVANNIYELDPTSGAIIQQFTSPGAYYACAGLEVDNMGNLWAIDQNTNTVYNIDSGVPMGDPGAPAAPSDLTITAGAGGVLTADLTWINPSLTIDGSTLTELTEIQVYRGEDLIYTNTTPTIGVPDSYFDPVVPIAGNHTYYVLGVNSLGDGIPASISAWIGEDVPDAITDLTLIDISTDDLIAQLDWVNPTAGLHGGYFPGITGYDIVRSDGEEFDVTGSLTTWQDDTIIDPGVYFYTVTPYNDSGSGPSTSSPQVGIGVSIIQVGNQEVTDYQMPMNIYYDNSIVECVYDMEWLGTDMLINAISFHAANIGSTVNDFNFEIWLGEVDIDDLSGGFIDATQLTMVYDGTISVPTGDYWLELPLDTAFEYTYSHNLVMGTVKDDDEWYSSSDTWWTSESGTANRTIHQYSDSEEYSIQTPPTSPMAKTTYPDVRFAWSPLEHGNVDGIVTDINTATPIEGAEVYVGAWGPVTTNAAGEYLVEDIVIGTQEVTAFKDGYYDFVGSIEVETDITVTYDFAMVPFEFATLEGTVTDADTGDPLVGANINALSAAGYEYDGVTDDTGYYEITDMVAETYDVSCSFPDYPTGIEVDVVLDPGQTVTVDFSLAGYAYWNDFETNNGSLVNSDNVWEWGAFTSGPGAGYSGTNGWATGIGGPYPVGANTMLDTPAPFLVEEPNAMLEFWHWYNIETSWDGGNVKISTDGGGSWSVIVPLTGYTGVANTSNPLNGEEIFTGTGQMFWELAQFDLGSYVGQSVMFRWNFGSDSSVTYDGWYIDDVAISGCSSPDQGWIEGTVTEFGSGDPIEGAVVTIDGGASATTIADGTFYIADVWPGEYDLTCEHPTYLPNTVEDVVVAGGVGTTVDISLLWSEIAVDPTALNSVLAPNGMETQTFVITNDGPGDLEYSIGYNFPATVTINETPGKKAVGTQRTNNAAAKNARNSSDNDLAPNAFSNIVSTPPTDDIYDLQFQFPVGVGGGEAGIECDGNYIYTTKWNGGVFYRYELDGTYIGEFAVAGCPGSIRDLAYDGTYFYGASATNTVYEMDFDSQTVISTINAPIAVRAIAYDPVNDGFWGNNWSDQITLFDRNGSTLDSFACGAVNSFYGFAWEDVLDGGPYLWGAAQGGNGNDLVKMDIANGGAQVEVYDIANSGVNYAAGEICGGLYITDAIVPGKWTIGGTVQNVSIWGLELADAVSWVMVTENNSGTVAGNGGTVIVEVTFDATDLLEGDVLVADLVINNNAGDDVLIPVSLSVVGDIAEENLPVLYTALDNNYPNPFNPNTNIAYSIKDAAKVTLEVYNVKGQLVKTLVNDYRETGHYNVNWNGKDNSSKPSASGVYFYKMKAGNYVSTKKMILMK